MRDVLHNPACAGASVYGRRQNDPIRSRPGSMRGTVTVAIADWAVCLKAAHPGYIGSGVIKAHPEDKMWPNLLAVYAPFLDKFLYRLGSS